MYANALRAQSHEFMNKLHVILGLVQLKEYDDLGDYIKDIAIQQKSETSEIINDVKAPCWLVFCSENKASYGSRVQILILNARCHPERGRSFSHS